MTKNIRMKAEGGHYTLNISNARLVHTVTKRVIQKNLWFVAVYALVSLASAIGSYFTSGFWSVGLSVLVTLVTLWLGWYMLREVVSVTHEIR